MRLAKFLATCGVASRRGAEEIVRAGRVMVAGEAVTDPARDVDADSEVTLDGRPVTLAAREPVVYALNKPAGVVSTARDPQGRPTVVAMVAASQSLAATRRLYPVGRLDADSTGLILLTDDGDLAYRLTHPSFNVDKSYRVVVAGAPVRERALRALRGGVELEDGRTAPARVVRIAPDTLEITIHEGRKRQVKRMCAQVGHRVRSLQRVRFGSLELGTLALGESRRLSAAEVSRLWAAGSRVEAGSRGVAGSRGAGSPGVGAPGAGSGPPRSRAAGGGRRPAAGGR